MSILPCGTLHWQVYPGSIIPSQKLMGTSFLVSFTQWLHFGEAAGEACTCELWLCMRQVVDSAGACAEQNWARLGIWQRKPDREPAGWAADVFPLHLLWVSGSIRIYLMNVY